MRAEEERARAEEAQAQAVRAEAAAQQLREFAEAMTKERQGRLEKDRQEQTKKE